MYPEHSFDRTVLNVQINNIDFVYPEHSFDRTVLNVHFVINIVYTYIYRRTYTFIGL